MLPPIPRCSGWVYSSLISPSRISLPRYGSRVGLHIVLFEACSAFTRVAACTLALSPNRDTLIEGFSHFVTSMTAPIASGGSESPGGACTHWKAPPCHGARQLQTFGEPSQTTAAEPSLSSSDGSCPRGSVRTAMAASTTSVESIGLLRTCGALPDHRLLSRSTLRPACATRSTRQPAPAPGTGLPRSLQNRRRTWRTTHALRRN